MSEPTIFQKQNIYLKAIFIALIFALLIFAKTSIVIASILLNLIFFIPDLNIIKAYTKTILRLSMFWICYLATALIFDIPFEQQISLLVKLLSALQISVFLLYSFHREYFLHDTKILMKSSIFKAIIYYFLYIHKIMEKLVANFKNSEIMKEKKNIKNIIDKIVCTINGICDNAEDIKNETQEIEINHKSKRHLISSPNIYLLYPITIYTLALSL